MPVAFLPSPAHSVWNLGPIPIRGYALCVILGVIAGLWITDRRYRRIGGRAGLILDIATAAVPAGLIGARAYSVITDFSLYFGHGRDWTGVLRIWDGRLGLPGGIAAGALAAWICCRRAGTGLRPVAAAAAPALAFGQAIAVWGNLFSHSLIGPPSTLPWAVEIAPVYRVTGFESFATFQPAFLYESVWNLIAGALVIYAIGRLLLTGDRAFALYAELYAIGRFWTEALVIGSSPHVLGLRVNQVVMVAVIAGSAVYLYATRAKRGPDIVVPTILLSPDADAEQVAGAAGADVDRTTSAAVDDTADQGAGPDAGAQGETPGDAMVSGDAMASGAAAEPAPG
jgi:prolipoprotein diacylglyceryl transferase